MDSKKEPLNYNELQWTILFLYNIYNQVLVFLDVGLLVDSETEKTLGH